MKGKAAERNRIADILSDTLKAMQKSGGLVRPKEHYALHKVFGLNPSSNQFEEAVHLHPVANVPDKNLRIFIEIINNNCETIVPSEDLLGSELIKTGGYICNYGLISKMFAVDGGYLVSFDDDEVPDYEDDNPYINIWDCSPSRDSEECVEELCEYLATPVAKGVYEFSLSSLRPNEIKWLGKWILVHNGNENIRLKYNVTSEVTDGTVSGVIEQNTSAEK